MCYVLGPHHVCVKHCVGIKPSFGTCATRPIDYHTVQIQCNIISSIDVLLQCNTTSSMAHQVPYSSLLILVFVASIPSSSAVKFLLISGLSDCVTEDIPAGVKQVCKIVFITYPALQMVLHGCVCNHQPPPPRCLGVFKSHHYAKIAIQPSL